METELDRDFKKQFKLSFIKSLKSGFNINEIKKNLKKQAYPRGLIEDLIKEFESDQEIIDLTRNTPKKPSFLEIIKSTLFKPSEAGKIKKITQICSLYYNLILDEKRKLNRELTDLEDIINNLQNKKLVLYFIRTQVSYINQIQRRVKKIVNIAKSLVNIEIKETSKREINKILEYVQLKDLKLEKELKNLINLKAILNSPEELRVSAQRLKEESRKKEDFLQVKIKEISEKSSRFKEVVSEL